MNLTYDPEADSLYFFLTDDPGPGCVSETTQLNDRVFVDLNRDGDAIGIEIRAVSSIEGMKELAASGLQTAIGFSTAHQIR